MPRLSFWFLLLAFAALGIAPASHAEDKPKEPAITTKLVEYKDGEVLLEGFLATPAVIDGERPAVLLCHAWKGRGSQVRELAERFAAEGKIAFALDMYGKGVLAKDNTEARALATPFYKDPAMMRARVKAGLGVLRATPGVAKARIAAIGFCFGGTTVLELARSGEAIAGVVSFHGGLSTQVPAEKGAVKAKVLVAHGGDDPYVPPDQVLAFWKEMRDAGVDHQVLILSGAVHAFTDTRAGDDPTKGAAYDEAAAKRSFGAMRRFFDEVLAP